MLAENSLNLGPGPNGLAHRQSLQRPIKHNQIITWSDVEISGQETFSALTARQKMDAPARKKLNGQY
jgi:predicted homoserine dehydrogenase-like protein